MKKIVLGLAAMLLTTSAIAESFFDYKQEVNLGYSYVTLKTEGAPDLDGYFLGIKALKTIQTFENGQSIAVGFGVNLTYVPDLKADPLIENDTIYYVDIMPRVTYVISDEIDVSTFVGYTKGELSYEVFSNKYTYDYTGISYGIGSSYEMVSNLRINLNVLATDGEYERNGTKTKADNVRYMIGVGYNF